MTPALTVIDRSRWFRWTPPEHAALRELRRSRPEHTSQTAAAALLGITPREYTFLEGGRLTLSEGDWQRAMEVIRG